MDNLIMLQSVTYAMKAKKILDDYGIESQVTRIPPSYNKGSCGYGLKINERLYEAVDILRERNIKVSGRALEDLN